MLGRRATTACALWAAAFLAATTSAMDISDELASGWRVALRPRQSSTNLQTFSGSLAGIQASAIVDSGDLDRPFSVDGDTFTDFQSAANRACDNQKNNCAEVANNQEGALTVSECDRQNEECKAAANGATQTEFRALVSEDAQFEYFCDL